ncbi:MAG: trxB2 [Polaromonas sp.]|nr:trxB2 [Polaromonas sp.]
MTDQITEHQAIETDALIVGAGPAGLFQAFQLGLLEISSHIVDALPYAGGQCIELYPDKPIYDIPGLPFCTGRQLVGNLLEQLAPFKPVMHLGQMISGFEKRPDGRFAVTTSTGAVFWVKCVVVAAGVGAFQPKRLAIEGIDRFQGKQLFYPLGPAEGFAGKSVLLVGGDDVALDWATALAAAAATARPKSIALLHRRDVLQASLEATTRFKAACEDGAVSFAVGQITGYVEENGVMAAVQVMDVEGQTRPMPVDAVLVFLGLSPRLGPIADWGLEMERKQVPVDTEKFSTRIPGVFAVGDINTYLGKKKLILSAFHECALAAFGVAAHIRPDSKIPLQYTTTSTRLHTLLGVAPVSAAGN